MGMGWAWGNNSIMFCRILHTLIKENQGFSLVEVMVAASVTSIITLAMVQLSSNISDNERRIWQAMNIQDLNNTVLVTLGTPDQPAAGNPIQPTTYGCSRTLNGLQIIQNTWTNVPDLLDHNGNPVFQVDSGQKIFGMGGGQLRDLKFSITTRVPVPPAANTFFPAVFRVEFKRFGRDIIRNDTNKLILPTEKEFAVSIAHDGTGKINVCLPNAQASACSSMGGTFDANTLVCQINKVCDSAGHCMTAFPSTQNCPVGKFITGFNSGGGIICN